MSIRLAVVVSHPIQYLAPLFRLLAGRDDVTLRVFYCCTHGLTSYSDADFAAEFAWDIPLLDGYDSEVLPIERQPKNLGFRAVDNPQAPAVIGGFSPDAVVLFGYAHRTNWRVAAWARGRQVPVLLVSDSSARYARSPARIAVKEAVVRAFYHYVDGALFVSDRNYCYHRHFGISADRLFRGILPVDNRRFAAARDGSRYEIRQSLGVTDDDFVVVLVAKLVARKRQLDLIRACAVASDGCQNRIWAVLVGDGPDRPALESAIRSTNAPAFITGFVNQSRIPDYYVAADAAVLCSDDEPFGLALSEAVSVGLPVVASDRVGAVGSIGPAQPGRNALVYGCGDVSELASTLTTLTVDGALRAELAHQSTHIAAELDLAQAASALAEAAQSLAAGSRR